MYWQVNSVTKTDSYIYPIARIYYCIDKFGSAKFVSRFDLLKGCWKVSLTETAKEISAFVTPDGLFLYKLMLQQPLKGWFIPFVMTFKDVKSTLIMLSSTVTYHWNIFKQCMRSLTFWQKQKQWTLQRVTFIMLLYSI